MDSKISLKALGHSFEERREIDVLFLLKTIEAIESANEFTLRCVLC